MADDKSDKRTNRPCLRDDVSNTDTAGGDVCSRWKLIVAFEFPLSGKTNRGGGVLRELSGPGRNRGNFFMGRNLFPCDSSRLEENNWLK